MNRLLIFVAIATLTLAMLSPSWAATNLNSSRSNIYRMVYDANVVSDAQATALLKELNKIGSADEKKLKLWLPPTFKRLGIEAARVKKISILMGRHITCAKCDEACKGKCVKGSGEDCFCYEPLTTPAQMRRVNKSWPILILLLANPGDEPKALAVSDCACPGKYGV
jgi:hypothetical protein